MSQKRFITSGVRRDFVKGRTVSKDRRDRALANMAAAAAAIRSNNRRSGLSASARLARSVERKFYDTMLAGAAIAAATDATGGEYDPSATSMISTPAQGDTEQSRDGKRIVIKNITFKAKVETLSLETQANPPSPVKVYLALVLDTQSNGTQINSEDVYKNLNATAGGTQSPMRNLLFAERFRILKDTVVDVTPQALSHFAVDSFSVIGTAKTIDWFIPMDQVVNFNATTTSTIAAVVDNSIHVIAFANTTSYTPTLNYNARIRFVG